MTGILSTQSLWATHASLLNDSEEIKLFFDQRLPKIIQEELQKMDQPHSTERINAIAIEFAGVIRNVTLRFNQPYIFSMCATKDAFTARNGLLSQWRGYGKDGGYAIIFDTTELTSRLTQEAEIFHYQHMQWADVHYYDESLDSVNAAPEIIEAEQKLRAGISGRFQVRSATS